MGIFITELFRNPEFFWLVTLAVIPSICLHEYCHAQIALWLGDDTAARAGHLTLNPLRQMGIVSIITFLIIGIAWGSVPADPRRLTKRGNILVSFAGPGMNLLLFLAAWIAAFFLLDIQNGHLIAAQSIPRLLVMYIFYLGIYNLVLFIFNMLPLPGFDGWHVFAPLFPANWRSSEYLKGVMLFVIFGVIFAFPFIFQLAEYVMTFAPVMHSVMFHLSDM